jgi:membrane fusion protein, multidrug efflux system
VDTNRSGTRPYRRRSLLVASGFAMLAAGTTAYWYWPQGHEPAPAPRPAARAPVPVSVAVAARQNISVHLTGLGTVQASATVRIYSQVEGKLQEVLFTEGQRVKQGDVLAKIDPRLFLAALDQAKAKKAQDEALLIGAEKELVRAKTLAQRDFGSQQNVDQNQAKVDQFKASIAADEAAIATARTQLDYATITAPNDGRIGIRLVDPGNLVRASDASGIASLVRLQPAAVIFTLPSRTLEDVRAAMTRGPVEVVAWDQSNRRTLATGTLLLVDNAVDPATSTIRLKAMFPNDDERLWPGDFVNARVLVEVKNDVLAMPSSAVQRGPQGLFTWIVTATNTAEPRPIEVGPTSGDLTVVLSGVREGERVVTDGQYKLQRNAPVSIAAPRAADAGSPR